MFDDRFPAFRGCFIGVRNMTEFKSGDDILIRMNQ